MTITPILLCGGAGTRLWPLSRKSYPKQFAQLTPSVTLFQSTINRLTSEMFGAPLVVTASDFRFIVTEQLHELGVDPGAILIEPEARNTGPAVLAAAMYLAQNDKEALMLVSPSDHVIPDSDAFRAAVEKGVPSAQNGKMVTFGITPDHAETGYGYLEVGEIGADGIAPLKTFIEKPNAKRAAEMLENGGFLWNAGIYLFSVSTVIAAFRAHAPDLIAPAQVAVSQAKTDLGFLRLDPDAWSQLNSISIDYAVMEKADNLVVVPYSTGWSDLGDWEAIWRVSNMDDRGVVTAGTASAIDCDNTLLRSEDGIVELVGIGLENIVAIATSDAVLVVDMSRTQDVNLAVELLKAKGATQAQAFPKEHRPWGWFETLVLGDRFRVKRIVVKPGGILSLQSHVHRAEHWVVVAGTAKVTIGDAVSLVSENQSVFIPLGEKHRMENPGKLPMVLIEVQTGSYLGEDDIIRYEDVYARVE